MLIKKLIYKPKYLLGTKSIAKEILTYAENNNVDLIVIGTKGRSAFKKALLGSVASSVLTHARLPGHGS